MTPPIQRTAAELKRAGRVLLCGVAVLLAPTTAAAPQYRLGWSALDAGGGAAAGVGTAIASSSVGQRAAPIVAAGGQSSLESGTPQFATDTDSDGLLDSVENVLTTSPLDSDSDDDGLSDFAELEPDGDPDTYAEGIDTDPLNADTDGDGIPDGADPEPLIPAATQVPALPTGLVAMLALALGLVMARARAMRRHR